MVTLLPGFSTKNDGVAQKEGADPLRFVAPSILNPPRFGVPDRVLLSGVNLGIQELTYDAVYDKRLSRWASKQLGYKICVDIHSDELGNALVIDTNQVNHMFAVGPRLELLNKYYGIGRWLLGLVRGCPLHIWTPEYIEDYSEAFEWMVDDICSMYPDWAKSAVNPHRLGEIPNMPPNLRSIVDECLAVDRYKWDRFCCFDNVQEYPFVMLSWYGNIPDFNKRTKKLNPYVEAWEERGSSKLWMLADMIADTALQSSRGMTCAGPFHSEKEFKQCIKDTAPFMRLLTYLSHDQMQDGFSLGF